MKRLLFIAIFFSIISLVVVKPAFSIATQEKTISKIAKDLIKIDKTKDKAQFIAHIMESYPWLNPKLFKTEIEQDINLYTTATIRIKIFSKFKPQTARQRLLLWEALNSIKSLNNTKVELPVSWLSAELSPEEEKIFSAKYRFLLNERMVKLRLSNLSWLQQKKNIEVLKQYISSTARKEFDSTLSLINKNHSKPLKADQYRSYVYVSSLVKAEKYDQASKIIISMDDKNMQPIQAEMWWKLRHLLAREHLKDKQYNMSYYLSKNHGSEDPAAVTDAEWLSGWIALRFLNAPKSAIMHFHKVYDSATMSDTRAKAAYWLWKSYTANKQTLEAQKWLNIATSYQGFFYGQVAALASGQKINPFSSSNQASSTNNEARKHVLIGIELQKQNRYDIARKLILTAAEHKMDDKEAYILADIVAKINDHELNVLFSKKLANNHNINLHHGYPTHLKVNGSTPNLYYAIMRQESNFNHKAKSPVGAYGLMQLMPQTAAMLSKKLKIPKKSYQTQIHHNIASGSIYLDMLRSEFNNSYIASIASYNAGKGNVSRWLEADKKSSKFKNIDDTIDWIETIPFAETRFYVKKVIANMVIYDHLMAAKNKTVNRSSSKLKFYLS